MSFEKKYFAFFLALFFILNAVFSVPSRAAVLFTGKVNADVLTMRSGPGREYAKVGQLKNGSTVDIYEESDGWYRVSSAKKWVSADYVKKSVVATSKSAVDFNVKVVTDILSVRGGPGKTYAKVSSLKRGAVVAVTSLKNGWYQVSGEKKWISANYVSKAASVPVAVAPLTEEAAPAFASEQMNIKSTSSANEVSTATVTSKPSTDCMTEIKRANAYCHTVAKGCPSYSKTPHCIEVNQLCEDRQKEALSYCPLSNQ